MYKHAGLQMYPEKLPPDVPWPGHICKSHTIPLKW
jgi:hypothetical protein